VHENQGSGRCLEVNERESCTKKKNHNLESMTVLLTSSSFAFYIFDRHTEVDLPPPLILVHLSLEPNARFFSPTATIRKLDRHEITAVPGRSKTHIRAYVLSAQFHAKTRCPVCLFDRSSEKARPLTISLPSRLADTSSVSIKRLILSACLITR
jgi:hypothetical protein